MTQLISFDGSVDRRQAPLVPHRHAFPSAMMSLGVLMGLPHETSLIQAHDRTWRMDHDHNLHMGLSGEAFHFKFDTAEYVHCSMPEGTAPVRDCFSAIGLPCEIHSMKGIQGLDGEFTDESEVKKLVVENLCEGFPVLLLCRKKVERVILAIGYEQDGEVLIAWVFSTGDDIPNKCFSPSECQYLSAWSQDIGAVVLVKGEPSRPKTEVLMDTCRRALTRNERILREHRNPCEEPEGSYYDRWIKGLRDNRFWTTNPTGFPYIYPDIFDLAERRIYGAEFLKSVGVILGTDKLLPAVAAGNDIHRLMWTVHSMINETEKGNTALSDWSVREKIVKMLNQCRSLDKRMAECIANTLQE